MSLYGEFDLDDQIERIVDTLHITNSKGGRNNEEGKDSDEDGLIINIKYDFNSVEKTIRPR